MINSKNVTEIERKTKKSFGEVKLVKLISSSNFINLIDLHLLGILQLKGSQPYPHNQ